MEMEDRPKPYIPCNPDDIIRARDWNDMQILIAEDIQGHNHTGGEQGVQIPRDGITNGAIDGSKIDPDADVAMRSLKLKGRDLLPALDDLIRRLAETARTTPPVGTVLMHAGSAAPNGYLLCDGRAVSRTEYTELFAVIGAIWGAGDGSTTFNLPDLRGRAPVGAGAGPGLTARQLGQIFGTETHKLVANELPGHTHGGTTAGAPAHHHAGTTSGAGTHNHTGNTDPGGGGHSHTGTTGSGNVMDYNLVNNTCFQPAIGNRIPFGTASTSVVAYLQGTDRTSRHDADYNMAVHTHNFSTDGGDHPHSFSISGGEHSHPFNTSDDGAHAHSFTTDNGQVGGQVHENMPPSAVLNYIIRY